ncbi:MAG: LemA family protein [Gammaproteobacteria bacterium]|nr:LemA family protein [Gammaproteobacteria bacterium]
MKMISMSIATLLLMVGFAVASYSFTHKQLLSMQKKIDTNWAQIESLQKQKDQKNIQSKLSVAGTQYNRLVENFNASINRFPGSYIAEEKGLRPRIFFKIDEVSK